MARGTASWAIINKGLMKDYLDIKESIRALARGLQSLQGNLLSGNTGES